MAYVKCDKCGGTGIIKGSPGGYDSACESCKGMGTVHEGSGTCSPCQGTGRQGTKTEDGYIGSLCSSCYGKGTV